MPVPRIRRCRHGVTGRNQSIPVGAERICGKRRIVFPFFQRVDHAALQLLEREYRCLVINKFTQEQVFKIVGAVFAFKLLNVEQCAATFQGVLNGDNLPPLAVRTEKPTGKGVMTDVDFHAFGGAGASPVEQFT